MQRWAALTGATGFIGSNVLTHLLSAGWRVRALYRPAERPPPAASGLEWVPGDLGDPSSLARLVRDTAAVVHCAGAVRGGSLSDFEPPSFPCPPRTRSSTIAARALRSPHDPP